MTSAHRTADSPVLREAAEWLLRMQEGPLDGAEQSAFETWRSRSERHTEAWERAQKLQQMLGGIPPGLGMRVLGGDRRTAVKVLTLALVSGTTATLGWRVLPWQGWLADQRTAVGEQRTMTLADGSTLHLNTDTAIDIRYDAQQRRIVLLRGELHIETAAMADTRPLHVDTEHGRLRALGTRFTVRLAERTHVGVSQGAVEVRPARPDSAIVIVPAGSETDFGPQDVALVRALDDNATAWMDGTLYADNMPLSAFLAQLSRYRSGVLRCDPAVADMPVSGAFQLDDPDRILDILQRTRPLRIVWRTRYWGLVQAAPPRS